LCGHKSADVTHLASSLTTHSHAVAAAATEPAINLCDATAISRDAEMESRDGDYTMYEPTQRDVRPSIHQTCFYLHLGHGSTIGYWRDNVVCLPVTAGPKSVRLGNGRPIITPRRLVLAPVSTPLRIVNRCCAGFRVSGGIIPL